LALAPAESKEPFLTFTPIGSIPNWSFGKNYESIRVQFSVFDKGNNKNKIVAIMKDIERIFHRTTLSFNITESSAQLVYSYKDSERILPDPKDIKYWIGNTDYIFVAMGDAQEENWSSSSSESSTSSSSSTSSNLSSQSSQSSVSSESTASSESSSSSFDDCPNTIDEFNATIIEI